MDIGDLLGCGGYLSRLERTRSGIFAIDRAISLEELKAMNVTELGERLLPL